jgi:hypothetical protein
MSLNVAYSEKRGAMRSDGNGNDALTLHLHDSIACLEEIDDFQRGMSSYSQSNVS